MTNMLILKKQKISYKLPLKLFGFGIKKVRYVLSELYPDKEDIISRIYKTLVVGILLLMKKKKTVTVVCLPPSKWMTLADRRIFLNPNSLIISWLQMSVQELIGKEMVLKPFWTDQCEEISLKLWLPIETDYAVSRSNFWNGSSTEMVLKSWFSMKKMENQLTKNSPTTFSPLFTSIPVEKWEEDVIRTKTIRLYPTTEQKKILKSWMSTRRYVYNKVLEQIKKGNETINFFDLRNKYVTAKDNPSVEKWELDTPKDIRAGAVNDLVNNYKTTFSLLKNNQIKHFNMSFQSKKKEPSIEIPLSAIKATKEVTERTDDEMEIVKSKISETKKVSKTKIKVKITKKDGGIFIYKNILKSKIKISKGQLKHDIIIESDCRLQLRNNNWFLLAPVKIKEDKVEQTDEYCALDPGVRSFQTIYSEKSVEQVKINNDMIKKLQYKLDKFKSLRDKKEIRQSSFKKRERRIYTRLNNLIDELHHKTVNYLTRKYKYIIIPSFESQDMVRNSKNRILNRNMLQLKHYKFQQRLKHKCIVRGCHLEICTEEYTSKTCGRCGTLNDVKTNDVYNCNKCKLVIDRDVNGARNIFIKVLNKRK
jgi:putative transposase